MDSVRLLQHSRCRDAMGGGRNSGLERTGEEQQPTSLKGTR